MITDEKRALIQSYSIEFENRYLLEPLGQQHRSMYKTEKENVITYWEAIKAAKNKGLDITDMVLEKLLPYVNTRYNRERGCRISVMPAIIKDIKIWFENSGWQTANNWTGVANAIYDLVFDVIEKKDFTAFKKFEGNAILSKGIKSGFITPTLHFLNPQLRVINNKTILTINYIHDEDVIGRDLTHYLDYLKIIDDTVNSLSIPLFNDVELFDMFCHYMCDKSLGGYAKYESRERSVKKTHAEPETGPEPEIETEINVIEEESPPQGHWEAIYYLVKTGKLLGYKTYVADPSKIAFDKKLGDIADLTEVPLILQSAPEISRVDVIWYKSTPPFLLFEIEDGGTMREALHRLYNAMAFDARFLIICPPENRAKFDKWVSTAPFREFEDRYNFRTYNELFDFYKQVKTYSSMKTKFLRLMD